MSKILIDKATVKQVLEALNSVSPRHLTPFISNARTALREALAENARELGLDYEPAQHDPVANYCKECLTYNGHHEGCSHYTFPPAQLPFGVGGGLFAIKTLLSRDPCVHANTAIQMIDAMLAEQPAQQQQEPVFWYRPCSNGMYEGPIHNAQIERVRKESGAWHPLYTSPPAQRKPLTSEEVSDLRIKHGITSNGRGIKEFTQIVDFVRDIEAAHGIKENT